MSVMVAVPHHIKERIRQDIVSREKGVESVAILDNYIEVIVSPSFPLPSAREVVVDSYHIPIRYIRGKVYSLSSPALANSMQAQATIDNEDCRTCTFDTIRGGISIGHYKITAGTFGSIVYMNEDSKWAILSNNHVIANTNNAVAGDDILQPGRVDGANRVVAKLERFVPIVYLPDQNSPITEDRINYVDAAIARPLPSIVKSRRIIDVGYPLGIRDGHSGMDVRKSGRTTGTNTGTIKTIEAAIKVNYGTDTNPKYAYFDDLIETGPMIMPGDSGSLLCDMQGFAVGLVFAGSFRRDENNQLVPITGYACRIRTALEKLQCTMLRRPTTYSNPIAEMTPRLAAALLTGGAGGMII